MIRVSAEGASGCAQLWFTRCSYGYVWPGTSYEQSHIARQLRFTSRALVYNDSHVFVIREEKKTYSMRVKSILLITGLININCKLS